MSYEYPTIDGVEPKFLKSVRVPRNSKGELIGAIPDSSPFIDKAIYELRDDLTVMIEPMYNEDNIEEPEGWTVEYGEGGKIMKTEMVKDVFDSPSAAAAYIEGALEDL